MKEIQDKRYIIENRTGLPTHKVFPYVSTVVLQGKVSDFGQQYCYHTVFKDGISVSVVKDKKSYRFVIMEE